MISSVDDPNRERLIRLAKLLGPLCDDLVFVGGSATGLLVTDPAGTRIRPTFDVDTVAEVSSYAEYVALGERLRKCGFLPDSSPEAPVCRWFAADLKLDVMPTSPAILGFTNRWYKAAMIAATHFNLSEDFRIRLISSPYFLGTKLEAFFSRGRNDFQASPDLEDLVTVVDGRAEIISEMDRADPELRNYVSNTLESLMQTSRFVEALPGYLSPDEAGQQRIEITLRRLGQIAAMKPTA